MEASGRYHDRVRYGAGAIRQLPSMIGTLGHQRVLLVTGKASFEASGAAEMMPELESTFTVDRWSDFSPNTDSADLLRGLDVVRDFRPDVVVGIGGGSPMDMAKLLVAYANFGNEDLFEQIRSGATIEHRGCGLALVPTTSGSGSEATHFAVVYIGDEKFSIAGPAMRPDAIVLDPLLAMSGSAHQRATSGIDALCQSIESLWAVAATDESRRYARHGLCLVSKNIRAFVHAPDEANARAMCLGSHLAGRAIDISKTTAAHALSYGITKGFGVDHGNAVALTLGAFIDLHGQPPSHRVQDGVDPIELKRVHDEIAGRIGVVETETALTAMRRLLEQLELTAELSSVGLTSAAHVRRLSQDVNIERLGNNPVQLDYADLSDIVRQCI